MNEKEFTFDNNKSKIKFIFENGSLSFYIQARHLGKKAVTSSTVTLNIEETIDFLNWIKKCQDFIN